MRTSFDAEAFEGALRTLRDRDGFVLLTHRRPDGDTIGSAAALCRGLRQLGKQAWLWPNPDITPRFAGLTEGLWAPENTQAGCVAAVDVADRALLPANAQEAFPVIDLAIDHHPSFRAYAGLGLCRPEAAACGEIVYDLLAALGCTLTPDMADAVYTAAATDTGCFVFDNTTQYTHQVAAACMAAGARWQEINYRCFRLKTRARAALEGQIYAGMTLLKDGRGAVALLEQALLERLGATDDDCDNLASLLAQVEGVEIGALLTEVKGGGAWKVSVRSRGHDASRICAAFGGGGHAGAAGCTLQGLSGRAAAEAMTAALEAALDA